jgi:hypothetical protein
MAYPRYDVEVVPRSAIRKGDTIVYVGRGGCFELKVESNPKPLGGFAKEVEVKWPGEDCTRGFSLGGRGATHLRLARA